MTYTCALFTLSACLAVGAFAACTTTNSASSSDGGVADGGVADGGATDGGLAAALGADGGALSSQPLTCLEVFQCGAACSGAGCEDACFARGTAEAKEAVTKVVACYQANACDGGDCLEANCLTEVRACGAQQDSGGKPIDAVPPATVPPATLVGKWHSYYAPNAATEDWTFNADGTAAHYSASAYALAGGGCQWAGITDSTGTVVVTDTTLTYYQAAGTAQESNCGFKTNKPAPMKAYTYAWAIDENGKLLLVDQNLQSCIANPGYASCRTTLDRQ